MVNEEAMKAALAACERELLPNYTKISEKFGIERTTLAKRHKGQTLSMKEAMSEYRQCLTNAQEEALIAQINKLTKRNLPPTT